MTSFLPKLKISKTIFVICLGACLYGLSIGMNFVITPLMLEKAGLSNTLIGVIMMMEMGATLIGAPLLPRFVHRFGINKALITCGIVRHTTLLFLPLIHNQIYWMICMFIFGLGGFSLFTVIQLWINSICTEENRGVSLSCFGAFLSLGVATGPFILKLSGLEGYFPFLVSSIISFLMFIPFSSVIHTMPKEMEGERMSILKVIKTTPLPILSGMFCDFVFFSMASFLVIYGMENGLVKEMASFLITAMVVNGIVTEIPIGMLVDRINRKYILIAGAVIIFLSSQLLPLVINKQFIFIMLVLALLSGSLAGIYTSSISLIGDKFKGRELVAANSAFAFSNCIGGMSGIFLTGAAMDIFGKSGLPNIIAIISTIYITMFILLNFGRKKFMQSS
jgi:MFS family permease